MTKVTSVISRQIPDVPDWTGMRSMDPEAAANALTGAAVGTGQGIASSTAGIGNAIAGGAAGVSNSLSGGLNSTLQYSLLQQLLQQRNPAGSVNNALGNTNPFQTG